MLTIRRLFLQSYKDQSLHHMQVCRQSIFITPFSGGKFNLILHLTADYPLAPPKVSFTTPVFHPNVDFKTGEVCLDVLKSDWSPAWGLATVCRAIVALLASPNADSPLNCDAGNLVRNADMIGFNSLARMYTIEYAT